ncbi:MAG: peptidase, partial [Candidatus Gagatemarchaeaceae archaeon]
MHPTTSTTHGFGWKKDLPDDRDRAYLPPPDLFRLLPNTRDLRSKCPPVYHQKELNSCSANAVAAAVEFDLIKEKKRRVIFPSRLFLYYNVRAAEGTVRSNVGISIRDTLKSVAKLGDCPESLWPYVEKRFRTRPPRECYDDALKY